MLSELDAHVAKAVEPPLLFNGQQEYNNQPPLRPAEAFGPTLAGPPKALGLLQQHAPVG